MNRLKEILNKLVEVFKKLSTVQKVIIGVTIVSIIGILIFTFSFSSDPGGVLLLQEAISMEDYAKITSELDKSGVDFTTKDDKYIIVKDKETGRKVRMDLIQKDLLPKGIKGWELFDMESWTTTQFERDIKLRRSLEAELEKHIESLNWVENAEVLYRRAERTIYTDKDEDASVTVSITPSYGNREALLDKELIKGIERMILTGLDGVARENITISDDRGTHLNDFTGLKMANKLKHAEEEIAIIGKATKKLEKRIWNSLQGVIAEDRYKVIANFQLNFNAESHKREDILPIEVMPDNPDTPYYDGRTLDTLKVSEKNTKEEFRGQRFDPEGPPGQEPNIPPGYKEHIDRWDIYNKNEEIINYLNGKKITTFDPDNQDIASIGVAIYIDGYWNKIKGADGNYLFLSNSFVREYVPLDDVQRRRIEDCIKSAINYKPARGDMVAVNNIKFDRRAQHEKEDLEWLSQLQRQKFLMIVLFSLLGIFIISIAYRLIKKEMLRRKRLRERELARQRQLQRDEALRALEADSPADTMSEADRQRMDLQERAEQIAMERPGDVAKLLRTWIQEDN